jgi:hypothetical protein
VAQKVAAVISYNYRRHDQRAEGVSAFLEASQITASGRSPAHSSGEPDGYRFRRVLDVRQIAPWLRRPHVQVADRWRREWTKRLADGIDHLVMRTFYTKVNSRSSGCQEPTIGLAMPTVAAFALLLSRDLILACVLMRIGQGSAGFRHGANDRNSRSH